MNSVDFAIGVLIVNSLAHFIFGITKTRYLGLFGYSPAGNIGYGVLQFVIAIVLLLVNYSFEAILQNGFVLGGLFVLVLFLVFGKFSLRLFSGKEDENLAKLMEEADRNVTVSEKVVMDLLDTE